MVNIEERRRRLCSCEWNYQTTYCMKLPNYPCHISSGTKGCILKVVYVSFSFNKLPPYISEYWYPYHHTWTNTLLPLLSGQFYNKKFLLSMSFVQEKNEKKIVVFLLFTLVALFFPPPFRFPPPPLPRPGLAHHYHHLPIIVPPPHPLCNTTLHLHHNCHGLHSSHHLEVFPFTAQNRTTTTIIM